MLIGVTGTGTDVGKTWVTAATIRGLRDIGISCAARKPAQSFEPDHNEPTDAEVLGAATHEPPHMVCPAHRWLPIALAPPMAAAALQLPRFTIAELINDLAPSTADIVFIEGAGGLRSPFAQDGDTLALFHATEPDVVVVVADSELGTINALRLTIDALNNATITTPTIIAYLNRFEERNELHSRNRAWLTHEDHFTVITSPSGLAEFLTNLREQMPSGGAFSRTFEG